MLDQEETGIVTYERLLGFLARALDRSSGAGQPPRSPAAAQTLKEECFSYLEHQLLRSFGRLLSNRLSRPRGDPMPTPSARDRDVQQGRSVSPALSGRFTPPTSAPGTPRGGGRGLGSSPRGLPSSAPASPRLQQPRQPLVARGPAPGRSAGAWQGGYGQADPAHRSSGSDFRPPARAASSGSSAGGRGGGGGGGAESNTAAARCHLLYHQAIFASRESAQLEAEIRELREREAMRECTFQPKLLPQRRSISPRITPQPRNFERAVSRMRGAQRQKEALHEARWRIPAGENYERLRRMGQQPFSCAYQDRPWARRGPPLFFVDVDVGRGRSGRIGVHEGDDLQAKARSFARAFQLDQTAALRLEDMLHEAYEERLRTMDLEARFVAATEDYAGGGGSFGDRRPAMAELERHRGYGPSSAPQMHDPRDGAPLTGELSFESCDTFGGHGGGGFASGSASGGGRGGGRDPRPSTTAGAGGGIGEADGRGREASREAADEHRPRAEEEEADELRPQDTERQEQGAAAPEEEEAEEGNASFGEG
mmetsp:Transcript_100100/g.321024  ORF Transcript_100100/g.321024 Transcript_100100/m.321024 type:complete len:539 (+) Transcript_100100:258-1874(+)